MSITQPIAFGSCNRQSLPQDFWQTIDQQHPSHFLWIGDAVYTKTYQATSLREAYDTVLNSTQYQSFVQEKVIDGVWDDHDYGVNDGGRDVSDRDQRQDEYLRFLQHSGNQDVTSRLKDKDALYHDLDMEVNGVKVKVLFLDTRSQRAPHFIRSLGEIKFPLSALISSAIRATYTVLGYGRNYDGVMLGEDQWVWLEETLKASDAKVHVIASSVQVMTSNPVFESWGHFPYERQRLFDLMATYDPSGLVFLSGDVHLAEISTVGYERENGEKGVWAEVTSSGLTHTCGTSRVQRYICPVMMAMFHEHRWHDNQYYKGKNFGLINIANIDVNIAVHTIDDATKQLEWNITLPDNQSSGHQSKIVQVDYPDLFVFNPWLRGGIKSLIVIVFCTIVKILMKWRGKSSKPESKKNR